MGTKMPAYFLFSLLLTSCALARIEIHDLKTKQVITEEKLLSELNDKSQIVLGEYHYIDPVQKAEGDLIEKIVKAKKAERNFTVAWEFLDYPEHERLSLEIEEWKKGTINDSEFLVRVFKTENAAKKHEVYLPFFRALRDLDGQLVATNAPREWKKIITTKGIGALDPKLIPPQCGVGSDHYLERFKVTMQDHVPADALIRYFEAQHYTDCVIAQSIETLSQHDLRFLIVGSFHSDYNDASVMKLKKVSGEDVVSIKIIDAEQLTHEELEEMKVPHARFGRIADFLYVIY